MDTGTTVGGVCAAIVAADHILARLKGILPNSTGQLLWSLITRRPVKAAEGVTDMAKFNWNQFAQALLNTGANAAQAYESKKQQNQSMHQGDYIQIGLMLAAAVAQGFHQEDAAGQSQST